MCCESKKSVLPGKGHYLFIIFTASIVEFFDLVESIFTTDSSSFYTSIMSFLAVITLITILYALYLIGYLFCFGVVTIYKSVIVTNSEHETG